MDTHAACYMIYIYCVIGHLCELAFIFNQNAHMIVTVYV